MAQSIQSKRLKGALRELGIKDFDGKTPSAKARRYVRNLKGEKRFHELGRAQATVWKKYNTPEQIEALRNHPNITVMLESENCIYLES